MFSCNYVAILVDVLKSEHFSKSNSLKVLENYPLHNKIIAISYWQNSNYSMNGHYCTDFVSHYEDKPLLCLSGFLSTHFLDHTYMSWRLSAPCGKSLLTLIFRVCVAVHKMLCGKDTHSMLKYTWKIGKFLKRWVPGKCRNSLFWSFGSGWNGKWIKPWQYQIVCTWLLLVMGNFVYL